MKQLLLLLLIASACTPNKEPDTHSTSKVAIYDVCDIVQSVQVLSIGACNSYGECGVMLTGNSYCKLQFPAVGETIRACLSRSNKEMTSEEYQALTYHQGTFAECPPPYDATSKE